MILCDECDLGNRQRDGWHYLNDPVLGGDYRVPCSLYPPVIDDTEPLEAYCTVCKGPCQGH